MPPNILLVLVDDMGYSDLGCYGGEIRTPVMDGLAESGVRGARFYNAAQCCPSRASLLTGLYPHQAGMGDMNAEGPGSAFWQEVGAEAYLGFKKDGIVTLPEALREAGYQTMMSGKWHLGDTPDNWPSRRGFERTFALIPGASEHFSGRPAWRSEGPIATFTRDGERVDSLPDDFYSTDTFTDEALEFIRESEPGRPWFLYLAYTAPHWPFQAHEEDAAKYDGIYDQRPEGLRRARFDRMKEIGLVPESAVLPPLDAAITPEGIEENREARDRWTRHYAGMIECIDRNIGRLVDELKERGEFDNTLIVFVSDNGADTVRGPLWGQLSNAPFRRYKIWTYDGGIATPLVVHWPDGLPESSRGSILHGYGHFIDVYPTLLDAAGAEHPEEYGGGPVAPPEGISLLPALRGEVPLPADRAVFWERAGNEAMRRGDWKLVRGYNEGAGDGNVDASGGRTGRWELYHVGRDPGETVNLAGQFPGVVDEMTEEFEEWAGRIGVVPAEEVQAVREGGRSGGP